MLLVHPDNGLNGILISIEEWELDTVAIPQEIILRLLICLHQYSYRCLSLLFGISLRATWAIMVNMEELIPIFCDQLVDEVSVIGLLCIV